MSKRPNTPPLNLRQHLEAEERRLLTAIKPLRAKLEPLESELTDVQRALRAVGGAPVSAQPPRNSNGTFALAKPGPSKHTIRRKAEVGVQTLTDTLRAVLGENRAGLTSAEIHKICEDRLGRQVRDENVRGQLSRLKKNGQAAWYDGLWYAFDDAPPVLGERHK